MKKQKESDSERPKKLILNKDTLRDLTAAETESDRIKGGRVPDKTMNRTQCDAAPCD